MKRLYCNPKIKIELFNAERFLTASGNGAESLSADMKAQKALETAGTTQITIVKW